MGVFLPMKPLNDRPSTEHVAKRRHHPSLPLDSALHIFDITRSTFSLRALFLVRKHPEVHVFVSGCVHNAGSFMLAICLLNIRTCGCGKQKSHKMFFLRPSKRVGMCSGRDIGTLCIVFSRQRFKRCRSRNDNLHATPTLFTWSWINSVLYECIGIIYYYSVGYPSMYSHYPPYSILTRSALAKLNKSPNLNP